MRKKSSITITHRFHWNQSNARNKISLPQKERKKKNQGTLTTQWASKPATTQKMASSLSLASPSLLSPLPTPRSLRSLTTTSILLRSHHRQISTLRSSLAAQSVIAAPQDLVDSILSKVPSFLFLSLNGFRDWSASTQGLRTRLIFLFSEILV